MKKIFAGLSLVLLQFFPMANAGLDKLCTDELSHVIAFDSFINSTTETISYDAWLKWLNQKGLTAHSWLEAGIKAFKYALHQGHTVNISNKIPCRHFLGSRIFNERLAPFIQKIHLDYKAETDSSITNQTLLAIAPFCKNLKVLNISSEINFWGNSIDAGLNAIAENCPKLTTLQIDIGASEPIFGNALLTIAQRCKNFHTLIVPNYRSLGCRSQDTLVRFLRTCKTMKHLHVSILKIGPKAPIIQAIIKNCKSLEYLYIAEIAFGLKDIRTFLTHCNHLIGLGGIIGSNENLRELAGSCKQLQHLHIEKPWENIDEGLMMLALNCPQLKSLYLHNQEAWAMPPEDPSLIPSNKVLQYLEQHCKQMETLQISEHAFNLETLSNACKTWKRLKVLKLGKFFTQKEDIETDLRKIKQFLKGLGQHNKHLSVLKIRDLTFTENLCKMLSVQCPHLEKIDPSWEIGDWY